MAYTPTNWSTGDTITASDMNKLENAVANAGGGGGVFFTYTTTNFPSGTSSPVLYFCYIKKTGNTYSICTMPASGFFDFMNASGNYTYAWHTEGNVPTIPDYYLAAVPGSSIVEFTNMSGGIASDPILIDGMPHFIITGDFSVTVNMFG